MKLIIGIDEMIDVISDILERDDESIPNYANIMDIIIGIAEATIDSYDCGWGAHGADLKHASFITRCYYPLASRLTSDAIGLYIYKELKSIVCQYDIDDIIDRYWTCDTLIMEVELANEDDL